MNMEKNIAGAVVLGARKSSDSFLRMFRRDKDCLAYSLRCDDAGRRWRANVRNAVAAVGIAVSVSACGSTIAPTYVLKNPSYCGSNVQAFPLVNSELPQGVPKCQGPISETTTTISYAAGVEKIDGTIRERRTVLADLGEGIGGAAVAGFIGRRFYKYGRSRRL